ncbi:uncharacterized protein V6R79_017818 [Siganus canaliculatus]
MWRGDEDPFKPARRASSYLSSCRDVSVDLPAPFAGDGSQSFLGWVRQLEVAVRATTGEAGDADGELVRILPTRLCKSAFLLWDSLSDAVKNDYAAVKEKMGSAFGQRQLMDRFRANSSARSRAPRESLEVYAADLSRLVAEAFPDYDVVATREEKFRRFLAGLDPALRAKCLEQGATDMEEALIVAERCENAREALQRDSVSTYHAAQLAAGAPAVHSVSVTDDLQRAVNKLTEEMCSMRLEMKGIYEENQRLRARSDRREQGFHHPSGDGCSCTCGEWGCHSRSPRDGRSGRSPMRGQYQPREEFRGRGRQQSPGSSPAPRQLGGRSPSPGWRSSQREEPRRRGVSFLPQQRVADGSRQGNGQ